MQVRSSLLPARAVAAGVALMFVAGDAMAQSAPRAPDTRPATSAQASPAAPATSAQTLPAATAAVSAPTAPTGAAGAPVAASAFEVPIALWTDASFPGGINFGDTNGISWGDYDRDGFPDVFACDGGLLWRNVGGHTWQLAADLGAQLPPAVIRYGSSFGDYDADGLPDLVTEPRKLIAADTCMHLLHNDGGGFFTDVAPTAALDVQPCLADSETAGWADVDGDGLLDLFLPVYPPWHNNGPGNFFFRNLGPVGPGGSHAFSEQSGPAGLDIPLNYARPEGAQFCDADGDGDTDLYSNGTLYQNNSALGVPLFQSLPTASSGIDYSTFQDEGTLFADYDLDGDLDLIIAFEDSSPGIRIFESRGDGTFFPPEPGLIDSPFLGTGLGLSAEDWDLDGDIDFSTKHIFRRNQFVETGSRHFTIATHPITIENLTAPTPAWADWDRDGDLDLALGNYLKQGTFWLNTLYDAGTPAAQRRFVRVVVLTDSDTVLAGGGGPGGTETEFGATVELRIAGESPTDGSAPALRRRRFVASAHGYLNQNAYELTFGLPADPFPANDALDLVFDVVVDFPGIASTATGAGPGGPGVATGGLRRIDRHVNPALGGIALASLVNAGNPSDTSPRTIEVFRSGAARVHGVLYAPLPLAPKLLATSGAGLLLPTASITLAVPSPSPSVNRFVGIELDTAAATTPVLLREIALDGQLDLPVDCDGPGGQPPFNLALWDVSVPGAPALVPGSTLAAATSTRNRRTFFPVNWALQPGHRYRVVARVLSSRFGQLPAGLPAGACVVNGGLNFRDDVPCNGIAVAATTLQATRAYLAVRWAAVPTTLWAHLGGGLAGSGGSTPALVGSGQLVSGGVVTLAVTGARPNATCWLVLGTTVANLPLKGGVLVPAPLIVLGGLNTSPTGTLLISAPLTTALPPAAALVAQVWVADPAAVRDFAASNGVSGTPPLND